MSSKDAKITPDNANLAPPTYTAATSGSSLVPESQSRFASLSLHVSNRLRFLRFPQDVIEACNETVVSTWKPGIQETRYYGKSRELKVNGHPWCSSGIEAIEARQLISALLARLHSLGWVLLLSTDINKKVLDGDALLFRYQEVPPIECAWASIGFTKRDKLHFIDCQLIYSVA